MASSPTTMAAASSSSSPPDLSHLTPEERDIIAGVMQRHHSEETREVTFLRYRTRCFSTHYKMLFPIEAIFLLCVCVCSCPFTENLDIIVEDCLPLSDVRSHSMRPPTSA